jgi:hypothetical protein
MWQDPKVLQENRCFDDSLRYFYLNYSFYAASTVKFFETFFADMTSKTRVSYSLFTQQNDRSRNMIYILP